MDINTLLEGRKCECGKIHTCDIDFVYIEKDAISHLTDICKDYTNILIVADENTFSAAGDKTVSALSGKQIKKVIFTGKKKINDAVAYAKDLKDRYTVLWLNYDLFGDEI